MENLVYQLKLIILLFIFYLLGLLMNFNLPIIKESVISLGHC